MARILCIDYGGKRTGLAVTDPLKIIATALTTVETKVLFDYLKKYFQQEQVELVLVGEPKNWDESDTHATPLVNAFVKKMKKDFPAMPLKMVDERYTSKLASQAMVQMGMKKKDRQKKRQYRPSGGGHDVAGIFKQRGLIDGRMAIADCTFWQ